MPRIRTIKPEFPQSESMGRVSRDARLLFILLWTLADDSGRLRGHSRMLASLLLPYDEDSRTVIPGCLDELEREKCILRYCSEDGSNFIQICNWESHQKIDKPSKSRYPEPTSRGFAMIREDSTNTREDSSLDQGPRIKDQGPRKGGDQHFSFSLDQSKHGSDEKFRKAWHKWRKHLSQVGKSLTATSEENQLYKFESFDTADAVLLIEFSIDQNAKNILWTSDYKQSVLSSPIGKRLNKHGGEMI